MEKKSKENAGEQLIEIWRPQQQGTREQQPNKQERQFQHVESIDLSSSIGRSFRLEIVGQPWWSERQASSSDRHLFCRQLPFLFFQ